MTTDNFKIARDIKVYSRGRKEIGCATGGTRCCQLEGCRGVRLGVRWPDKKLTWPCTKGMLHNAEDDSWEIM